MQGAPGGSEHGPRWRGAPVTEPGPKTPRGPLPPPLPLSVPTPREPYAPAPSVASAAQVTELAKVVLRKLNEHGDRLDVFHQELALLRQQPAPNDTSDTMPSPPSPSLPGAVAQHAVTGAKWLLVAIGALGVAVQAASYFKPGLVGPLETVLRLLQQVAAP